MHTKEDKDGAEGLLAWSLLQELELGKGRLHSWPKEELLKGSSEDACCCRECQLFILSHFFCPAGRHTQTKLKSQVKVVLRVLNSHRGQV